MFRFLERAPVDGLGDEDGGAADRYPDQEKREQPADPFRPGDPKDSQRGHEITLGGDEDVGQTVPQLISQDICLSRDPEQVPERREDRHGDRGLSASRRHKEMEQVLDDIHPDGADRPRTMARPKNSPESSLIPQCQRKAPMARSTSARSATRRTALCRPVNFSRSAASSIGVRFWSSSYIWMISGRALTFAACRARKRIVTDVIIG